MLWQGHYSFNDEDFEYNEEELTKKQLIYDCENICKDIHREFEPYMKCINRETGESSILDQYLVHEINALQVVFEKAQKEFEEISKLPELCSGSEASVQRGISEDVETIWLQLDWNSGFQTQNYW